MLVSQLAGRHQGVVPNISGVHAKRLRTGELWPRSRANDAPQSRLQQLYVMPIGPACDQRQRDATRVDQKASLASIFSPDPWGSAPRIRLPEEPCAWPHRCFASARRCPPSRRIRRVRPATGGEKSQRVAIVESVHEPRWNYRIHAARPSTGSPYATHKRWRKRSVGRESACVPRRVVDDTGVRQAG